MIGSRLSDPNKLCSSAAELNALQEKVSSCMTRLYRRPENGGNPFLFSYAASKPHELKNDLGGGKKLTTAATDGRRYFWSTEFLAKLTPDELSIVMQHENYHVVFFHCKRGRGKNQSVWNLAVDYVANACIWRDHELTHRKGTLWGGNIGDPMSLATLLAYIDGKQEMPEGDHCFADKELFGRSPDAIYDEIIDHWNKSPRKCPKCGSLSLGPKGQKKEKKGDKSKGEKGDGDKGKEKGDKGKGPGQPGDQGEGTEPGDGSGDGQGDSQDEGCGCGGDHEHECDKCGSPLDGLGSMDSHIESDMTKQEVDAEVMRAAEQCRQMKGSVPGEIEGMLGELTKPELKFSDIVRSALYRKVQDAGLNNDYKRLRRRFLCTDPVQYLPRRYQHKPKWLAALDTSGSMGETDMAYGISQLQVLGSNTDGTVVPMDSTTKWEDAVRIENATASELMSKVKVTGRGGTDFCEFFANYAKKLGTDFDVIVILTDGDCGTVPIALKPRNSAVVWVLTRNNTGFVPPFGRLAHLRHDRL